MEANELAKATAQKVPLLADVFYQALTIKAIKEEEDHPLSIHAISSDDCAHLYSHTSQWGY